MCTCSSEEIPGGRKEALRATKTNATDGRRECCFQMRCYDLAIQAFSSVVVDLANGPKFLSEAELSRASLSLGDQSLATELCRGRDAVHIELRTHEAELISVAIHSDYLIEGRFYINIYRSTCNGISYLELWYW